MNDTEVKRNPIAEFLREVFNNRVEETFSLRVIVLALSLWVTLSLAWIGTQTWIWTGGAVLLIIGQLFSWRFRHYRSPIRSGIVALAVLSSMALVPRTISQVLNGDWLPVAHFLLLFLSITSFEMRTRAGLYANIGLNGVIFFFVSQQALDLTFGVFLTGFVTLFISFLAMSSLIDQAHEAEVRWFKHKLSFPAFWTAVFVISLAASVIVFLLMPKSFDDPIEDAQAVLLPLRASKDVNTANNLPDFDSVASAMPFSSTGNGDNPELQGGTSQLQPPQGNQSSGQDGSGLTPGGSGPDTQTGANEGNSDNPIFDPTAFGEGIVGNGEGNLSLANGEILGEDVVMQVRSPVLTYWRDKAFDTFDGEEWTLDLTSWYLQSSGRSTFVFASPQPRELRDRPRYLQIYFLKDAAPGGSIYSGYSPIIASIPNVNGEPATSDGAIYRVMSALPDFTVDGLGQADPRSNLEFRYHYVPDILPDLDIAAAQIAGDATTDLERARRIVTFLDRNYSYLSSAEDQLELSKPPTEFLADGGAGTSMDFATATVMLSRAVGIPSRLITGYLPGSFDPLSGTYIVRASDQHAWAEMFFNGIGWVPFDSAPRPATAAFGEGGASGNAQVSAVFDTDYGSEIYQSIRSSPELITDSLSKVFQSGVLALIAPIMTVVSLIIGAYIAWKYGANFTYRRNKVEYAGLPGDRRDEMIKTFRSMERLLKRVGLTPRGASQTIGEYTSTAASQLKKEVSTDLEWMRDAAQNAAYNPSRFDASLTAEAKIRLARLKGILKSQKLRPA